MTIATLVVAVQITALANLRAADRVVSSYKLHNDRASLFVALQPVVISVFAGGDDSWPPDGRGTEIEIAGNTWMVNFQDLAGLIDVRWSSPNELSLLPIDTTRIETWRRELERGSEAVPPTVAGMLWASGISPEEAALVHQGLTNRRGPGEISYRHLNVALAYEGENETAGAQSLQIKTLRVLVQISPKRLAPLPKKRAVGVGGLFGSCAPVKVSLRNAVDELRRLVSRIE